MIDAHLRPVKDRVARPLVRVLAPRMSPSALTSASLVTGVAAGAFAALELFVVALLLWWLSRVADGLDGAVARQRGSTSDLGGYLDQLADTVVYAVVPLGLAFAVDDRATWIACAALLASFYVNSVSWAYLSALMEKRGQAGRTPTSISMPVGVIEGTETIVLYSLMLALPRWLTGWMWLMTALVVATIAQRALGARTLRS
ncbi:MAG: CDP-alcohol phosphatidyltransferase family protein [Acidimicrobiales bacterium]|nr:CDP-alcohol phosphatidyltransferase family protein [Acidimicrobiales bacterium]